MKTFFPAAALAASLTLVPPGMAQHISATLVQTGVNNSASIEQDAVREGLAVITQIGNDNIAGGEGKAGGVVQRDARGRVFVTQRGNGNVAGIEQERIWPHGEAVIDQLGSDNVVLAREQNAFYSGTDARQKGTRNVARLNQVGGDIGMRTRQTGADNTIVIDLVDSSYGGPLAEQHGVGNRATITQYRDSYSNIYLAQTGMLNNASISQSESSFTSGLSVVQNGTGNQADAANSGSRNMSFITQTGDGNTASLRKVARTSESRIRQTGNLNTATISQNAAYPGGPRSDNIARITQTGDGFTAGIAQAGSGNIGTVYQH